MAVVDPAIERAVVRAETALAAVGMKVVHETFPDLPQLFRSLQKMVIFFGRCRSPGGRNSGLIDGSLPSVVCHHGPPASLPLPGSHHPLRLRPEHQVVR